MSVVINLANNADNTKTNNLQTLTATATTNNTAATESSASPTPCKIQTSIVKTNFKYDKTGAEFQLDKELFTFKPKLNRKSTLLAQNLISFYERQNLHSRKQLELVSSNLTYL